MLRIDVHQHLWTEPLVRALEERREFPFVRHEQGLTHLFLAGERPSVLDLRSEAPARRAALVEADGLDGALVCLSSPLGIESLPRRDALPLIDAYHDGALSLQGPFGVWGSIAVDGADGSDVDRALDGGCVGISLPAGALSSVTALSQRRAVLARLAEREAPLFIHPGPGPGHREREADEVSLGDPLWWPALTRYVAQMQAAWLAFQSAGRRRHPRLRVVFAMLAGLAPLHLERLGARGGLVADPHDPLIFYDTSSYGAVATGMVAEVVGREQLLYGSDRPVVGCDRSGHGARAGGARGGDPVSAVASATRHRPRAAERPPLAEVPRPRGRDLTGPELQRFVEELADRPELWISHVKHDATQRVYEELLSDEHLTVWLICWMDDQDTGYHDHDVSAGAVAVVGGGVREERLRIDGDPQDRSFAAGDSFHFSPADIHRVRHEGSDPAVTIHAYSPPLDRMGAYVIGSDGVLARHSVSSSQELRPLDGELD